MSSNKSYIIYVSPKYESVKHKIEKDIYHYDHINKKMLKFRCGKLKFVYDVENKISVPVPCDDFYIKNERRTDESNIRSWIDKIKSDVNIIVSDKTDNGFRIEVSEKDDDDIVEHLRRSGFFYDKA